MTRMTTKLPHKAAIVEDALRKSVAARKPSKYRNTPVVHDGIRFASKAEGKRYLELKLLEESGLINCLTLQPVFHLKLNGVLICKYVADFTYVEMDETPAGTLVVEDVKGVLTPEFKLKAKMFAAQEGYPITLVKA